MKKIIAAITLIVTMAFSAAAFAADGGALNRQQNTAEKFINAFSEVPSVYTEVTDGFDASLKEKVTGQSYGVLQKAVSERFGTLRESKFYSFQRYDDVDHITYIASFSKEKLVSVTLVFNKKNKMVDFALTPVNQNEAQ